MKCKDNLLIILLKSNAGLQSHHYEKQEGTVQSVLPNSWFGLFWTAWGHQYWTCGLVGHLVGKPPYFTCEELWVLLCRWKLRHGDMRSKAVFLRQNTLCKLSPGSAPSWENNIGQANWGNRKFKMSSLHWGRRTCLVHLYWCKPWVSRVTPDLYVLKC